MKFYLTKLIFFQDVKSLFFIGSVSGPLYFAVLYFAVININIIHQKITDNFFSSYRSVTSVSLYIIIRKFKIPFFLRPTSVSCGQHWRMFKAWIKLRIPDIMSALSWFCYFASRVLDELSIPSFSACIKCSSMVSHLFLATKITESSSKLRKFNPENSSRKMLSSSIRTVGYFVQM